MRTQAAVLGDDVQILRALASNLRTRNYDPSLAKSGGEPPRLPAPDTIASNVGTFLVYGATCLIAVVAFGSRHDKHVGKHYVVPLIGALCEAGTRVRWPPLGMLID
jgi:hypothetical protein